MNLFLYQLYMYILSCINSYNDVVRNVCLSGLYNRSSTIGLNFRYLTAFKYFVTYGILDQHIRQNMLIVK